MRKCHSQRTCCRQAPAGPCRHVPACSAELKPQVRTLARPCVQNLPEVAGCEAKLRMDGEGRHAAARGAAVPASLCLHVHAPTGQSGGPAPPRPGVACCPTERQRLGCTCTAPFHACVTCMHSTKPRPRGWQALARSPCAARACSPPPTPGSCVDAGIASRSAASSLARLPVAPHPPNHPPTRAHTHTHSHTHTALPSPRPARRRQALRDRQLQLHRGPVLRDPDQGCPGR